MGGFRTVFGGFCCIGAGIIAIIFGLVNPASLGLSTDNWMMGFFLFRWGEAMTLMETNMTFGVIWMIGLIVYVISSLMLAVGGLIGFWKGGYAPLIGAVLFFSFDLIVNLSSIALASSNTYFMQLVAIVVLISGSFGGILQASATQD